MDMEVLQYGTQHSETIMLLHGGGLSWWHHREAALRLAEKYQVILPILDGHAGSNRPFVSIEENGADLIRYIDAHCGGKLLLLGGTSLGGQVAASMLAQRPDLCRYALLESVTVKPAPLTRALISPVFGMSFGLIKQKWFARLQGAYLGIPKALFEEYYRDTCAIRKKDMITFLQCNSAYCPDSALADADCRVHIVYGSKEPGAIRASAALLQALIPNSTAERLTGYSHGELSLAHPALFAETLNWLISQP